MPAVSCLEKNGFANSRGELSRPHLRQHWDSRDGTGFGLGYCRQRGTGVNTAGMPACAATVPTSLNGSHKIG